MIFSRIIAIGSACRDFIIDLLFPAACLGCGRSGAWLCPACRRGLRPADHDCPHCQRPEPNGQFCPACAPAFHFRGLWAAGDYSQPLMAQLIKSLKYHNIRELADILADLMAEQAKEIAGRTDFYPNQAGRAPLLVPVPLHPKRQRQRGFNQAELLAEKLRDKLAWSTDASHLVRVQSAGAQAKLSGAARAKNLRGAFVWRSDGLAGQNIILVDDVATTGTTLNECAAVLKKAGAGEIWGLVAAK